ncbi:hypothetical protein D3C71_1390120 [compost metagenome]
MVNHEDRLRPQQAATRRTHQPDRAGTEDRHRGTRFDACIECGLVTGRQDVGEEQHLLIGERIRNAQRPDVGLGHAHELRLPTRYTAIQMAVAEQGRRRTDALLVHRRALAGVGGLAGRELGKPTMETLTTRNHERNHHAVARAQIHHARAHLLHYAHELMTEHVAGMQIRDLAAVQMQVRAADRRGGDTQDDVVRGGQRGIGHGIDPYILAAVVSQCAHSRLRYPSTSVVRGTAWQRRDRTVCGVSIRVNAPHCRGWRAWRSAGHGD